MKIFKTNYKNLSVINGVNFYGKKGYLVKYFVQKIYIVNL